MNIIRTTILSLALAFGAGAVVAQDFDKGMAAAQAGDWNTALKEWRPLALQGQPKAQTNLGNMYRNGQGVPKDKKKAVNWYTLAADQEFARAKFLLKTLLFSKGYEIGCTGASEFFKKAKKIGEINVNKYLEFCETLVGDLRSKNFKEAASWFRLAAAQGNANAQRNLGLMYARGNGVFKDEKAALNWYLAAAKQGDKAAGELAGELLVRDIVYGSTVDKLHNLEASISGCFSIRDAKCAFDKIWEYLDISKDGNLSIAEISKFQRNLVKFAYVEEMQDKVAIEEVAAINLTTILLLPITSSSILHSFDYNNDGTLQKEEVFGETEFAKLVGIDAQSLISGVEFQTLGNKLNDAMKNLPLPF